MHALAELAIDALACLTAPTVWRVAGHAMLLATLVGGVAGMVLIQRIEEP